MLQVYLRYAKQYGCTLNAQEVLRRYRCLQRGVEHASFLWVQTEGGELGPVACALALFNP